MAFRLSVSVHNGTKRRIRVKNANNGPCEVRRTFRT